MMFTTKQLSTRCMHVSLLLLIGSASMGCVPARITTMNTPQHGYEAVQLADASVMESKRSSSFVEAEFFEIPIDDIDLVSINHAQGSISLLIDGKYYFYFVKGGGLQERIQSVSALLNDIHKANSVQIKHIEYGLHREIVNLLLFYGDREIPESLEHKGLKDDNDL